LEAGATDSPKDLGPDCDKHGKGELWVICVHATAGATPARFTPDDPEVTGDVLCPACRCDDGLPPASDLRVACGACVREKFKIEGAS
jgi:hypothetical protein